MHFCGKCFFFQIFLSERLCTWLLCPTVGIGAHHLSAGVACSAVNVNVYCSLYDRAHSIWLVNIRYVFYSLVHLLSVKSTYYAFKLF